MTHASLQLLLVSPFQKLHQVVRLPLEIKVLAELLHVLLTCERSRRLVDLNVLIVGSRNQQLLLTADGFVRFHNGLDHFDAGD